MPFVRDLLKIQQTEFELRSGRILISVPFYNDVVFNRSVVLLTDYSSECVTGLMLNRRLPYTVNQLVPELNVEASMFLGGPVQLELLSLVHNFGSCRKASVIAPEICVGYDQILLSLIEQSAISGMRYRFMMGYAGWSPGQLESEIQRNMWVIGNPTPDLVFKTPPDEVWTRAVRVLGEEYADWLRIPVSISSN